MDTQALRKAFVDWCLSQEGKSYCWPTAENRYSGKNTPGCVYPDTFDCSGLVTNGLYHVSPAHDFRLVVNAQGLWNRTERVDKDHLQPGDLAFYGKGTNMIDHVMVVVGDGRVFGACGGTHLTATPDIARQSGARVRFRPSPEYRSDLRGFGAFPLPLR